MKKEMIRSTVYLLLLSLVAKILSFFVRIACARVLTSEAMNYYTLVMPTMIFLITLAQMGLPTAVSKIVASKKNYTPALKASIILSVANNILLTIFFVLAIPLFAKVILKQQILIPVLFAVVPMIPLVSISGLLKGYFMGKQEMIPSTACQITEEVIRIVFLLVVFTLYPVTTPVQMAVYAMASVSIGELGSILHLLLALKGKKRSFKAAGHLALNLNKETFDELLSISLPMTGSRLIGSLTAFLEPMCLVLFSTALLQQDLISTYGQLNGYVLPLLTLPSFATITLSNWLLPSFTYQASRGHLAQARKLFLQISSVCLLIGVSSGVLLFLFAEPVCQALYHQTQMAPLLRTLALPFILYSIQPALTNVLHAFSCSAKAMIDTCLGSILRLLCISFLTIVWQSQAVPFALVSGMLLTTLLHGWRVFHCLFQHKETVFLPEA